MGQWADGAAPQGDVVVGHHCVVSSECSVLRCVHATRGLSDATSKAAAGPLKQKTGSP